ncbi:maltose acetyltransferase domain-containing protein [Niastella koreensis]|uniref:maltose acetyltransferase domain-containing protein n=1 Tax=Niastella koreensis TaxID=354356 RepID=UPI001A980B8D
MRTEKEKMLAGELYNPLDEQLSAERAECPVAVGSPERNKRRRNRRTQQPAQGIAPAGTQVFRHLHFSSRSSRSCGT